MHSYTYPYPVPNSVSVDSNMYFGYANILLAGFKNAFG